MSSIISSQEKASLRKLCVAIVGGASLGIVLGVAYFSTFVVWVYAQTEPQFIPFWRAETYAPAGFSGKVFPTEKTVIEASFELLEGGKFLDLSKRDVIWLANDNEIGEGQGLKNITFKNYAYGGGAIAMEARVFGLDGKAVIYSFSIPATTPKLVIESPYDTSDLSEKNLELFALPYFFNINNLKELVLAWAVNGVSPEGDVDDPSHLSLEVPTEISAGAQITVTALAKNPASSLEEALGQVTYTVGR